MRAGRILAALLAATALVVTAGAAPAAAAPVVTAAGAEAQLVVAPRDGGLVGRGRDLDVDVQVTNSGSVALPAGRLAFSVERSPVASATELVRQISNPVEVLLGNLLPATGRTPALDVGESTIVRVRIDGGDLDDNLTTPDGSIADGARLLYVQYSASRVRQVAESAVVRMSNRAARIGFGTVVPVTMPAGTTGVVDVADQASLTASGGAWSQALDAASAMPSATVALDPAVIASIRLAGDAAPASATRFLGDLADLPNQVVRLPYADGDLTLQRAAGLSGPLAPESFISGATAAASGASATPAPTPAPSATASAADLTDWDWSRTTLSWPVPGTTTAGDLAAMGERGAVLLGSGDVQDTTVRTAAGPSTTVYGTRVLVADGTLSGLLATATGEGMAARAALTPLVGALATDAVTGAAPAVLAVAGRGADPGGLSRVLDLLDGQRWIRGESADDLLESKQAQAVNLKAGSAPAARVTTARALLAGEAAVRRLASAVPDPDALTAPFTLATSGLLSAQWRADDTRWSEAAGNATAAMRAVSQQVKIQASDRALVSTDGQMTVVVQNGLDQAVKVDVAATVNNGRLQFNGRPTRLVVSANANAQTKLTFRTIANGPAQVVLTASAPDGTRFGQPSIRQVQVQAGFDVVVAVVLLTLLGMLLALGVYRNIVRRRKPRAGR